MCSVIPAPVLGYGTVTEAEEMREELWEQPQAWVQPSGGPGLFRMDRTPKTSNPACEQCPPFTPSRALTARSSCSSSLPKLYFNSSGPSMCSQ